MTPGVVVYGALHGGRSARRGGTTRARCDALSGQDGVLRFDERTTLPTRPLIGCLAVAPAEGEVHAKLQGRYGGNIDCRELRAGATLILPVEHDGGGLYFGDCKALMGDGEIVGPPEVGALVTASAEPCERPASLEWPRIVTRDSMTTLVSGKPLEWSARQAFRELLNWVTEDYALPRPRPRCCSRWSRRPASARSATPTTPPTARCRATCSSRSRASGRARAQRPDHALDDAVAHAEQARRAG